MGTPVSADKPTFCLHYGLLLLGDGAQYMVAKIGFGPTGTKLMEAMDGFETAGTNHTARAEAANKVLHIAMGLFYSEERIQRLIDADCFGMEHYLELMKAVVPGNLEKKSSAAETSEQLSGAEQ